MALTGDPIPPYVKTQIDKRQSFYGSGVTSNRTPQQINYINNNSSWVKLASGVNVSLTALSNAQLPSSLSGKKLSEKYVLFAGTSEYTPGTLTQKGGFDSSYDNSEYGQVPMPGIIFTDVKTLNRGSIKKSTVKILAHSKEQFAALNLLYMRIGYTVFLEWGNTSFINNNTGNVEHLQNTLIENTFFDLTSNGDYSFILPKIEKYREKYDGNYDALLGKVSNFEWNFTANGWEISLTICSLGDVIESLKTNIPISNDTVKFLDVFRKDGVFTGNSADPIEKNKDDNLISSLLFLFKFIDDSNKDPKKNVHIKSGGKDVEVGYFLDVSKFVSGGSPTSGTGGGTVIVEEKDFIFESQFWDPFSGTYKTDTVQRRVTGIFGSSTDSVDAKQSQTLVDYFNAKFNPTATATLSDVQPYTTVPTGFAAKRITKTPLSSPNSYSSWSYPKVNTTAPTIAPSATPTISTPVTNPLYNIPSEVAWKLNTVTPQYYLRFGYLLEYIKKNIVPVIKNPNKTSLIDIDYNINNSPMYCLPISISVDPRVCQVKNENFIKNDNQPQSAFHELKSWKDSSNDHKAYAMNIYLNFTFITDCINSNLDEKFNLNLHAFLSAICNGLNKALGGVNNLEPVIDEDFNMIRIIDSTPIPNNFSLSSGVLHLYGYKGASNISNFVREISLKTVITPELATMLTVGATNSGYVKGVEGTAFKHFNDGLTDRFNDELVASNPNTSDTEAEDNYEGDFINWITLCYGFNGDLTADPPTLGELDEALIKKNISIVTEYYKYLIAKKQSDAQAGSIGFIPFKLTFTLDGISGIKIYNQLSIDTDFLPTAYGKTLIFIIVGINHKIQNNEWITEITASPIPKTSKSTIPTRTGKVRANKARVITLPPSAPGGGVGGDPIGPGLGTYTYDQLEKAAKSKGHKWFTRPNELNIIGIRNSSTGNVVTNKFDDMITISWLDNSGAKQTRQYAATTDPGRIYASVEFINAEAEAGGGTARLVPGQYLNAYERGIHDPSGTGGNKEALRQIGNVTVWRDPSLNNTYDNISITTGANYGINIHRAGVNSEDIENWSAGCQVFKRAVDINGFIGLCDVQKGLYGNVFTYTLITTLDIVP